MLILAIIVLIFFGWISFQMFCLDDYGSTLVALIVMAVAFHSIMCSVGNKQ